MIDANKVKHDSLETMYAFSQMQEKFGKAKPNIPAFKEYCGKLCRAMTQKSAGQRTNKPHDIDWNELDTIINCIVIEALALFTSGVLDKLEGSDNE